jgi:hypothetical protein
MQSLLCILCGLGLIGIGAVIHAAFTAPEGVEDEKGFHFLGSEDAERYSPRITLGEGDVIFFK